MGKGRSSWLKSRPLGIFYQLNELNFQLQRCRDVPSMKLRDLHNHFATLQQKELSLLTSKVLSFLHTSLPGRMQRRILKEFVDESNPEEEHEEPSVVLPVLFGGDGCMVLRQYAMVNPCIQLVCSADCEVRSLRVVSDSSSVITH